MFAHRKRDDGREKICECGQTVYPGNIYFWEGTTTWCLSCRPQEPVKFWFVDGTRQKLEPKANKASFDDVVCELEDFVDASSPGCMVHVTNAPSKGIYAGYWWGGVGRMPGQIKIYIRSWTSIESLIMTTLHEAAHEACWVNRMGYRHQAVEWQELFASFVRIAKSDYPALSSYLDDVDRLIDDDLRRWRKVQVTSHGPSM